MKRFAEVTGVLVLAAMLAAAQSKPNAGFEKLKTLVGEWQGTSGTNKPATISYKLVSGGSALVERLVIEGEGDMVTVYYVDGDRLMMTHYCAAGNQPRMLARPVKAADKSIDFAFLDATNLPDAGAGHMHALSITLVDNDHFTQQWTWRERGKDDIKELFRLKRVR